MVASAILRAVVWLCEKKLALANNRKRGDVQGGGQGAAKAHRFICHGITPNFYVFDVSLRISTNWRDLNPLN
jgi:hypothetical protein